MAKSRSKEIHMKHDLIASWKTTSKLDIATWSPSKGSKHDTLAL
jgi:hypothetical protein